LFPAACRRWAGELAKLKNLLANQKAAV